ncbi:MAG: polyprenyl diphosphate synthase [Candidatus Aenigmatarchaeota archaeon]
MKNKGLHVGIIPDGNRRWANEKKLPTREGHRAGARTTEKIFNHILDKYTEVTEITVWAFSTENFKRTYLEKRVLYRQIKKELEDLTVNKRVHDNRIKVNVIGQQFDEFPKNLKEAARQTMHITRDYGNRVLNIGVGYGGQFEITRAAINFARWLKDKPLVKKVKDKTFEDFLSVRTPLDIVIRTGGEKRLSGFMLYQMAYAELFFTDTLWPNFTTTEFDHIMKEFKARKRRFGN